MAMLTRGAPEMRYRIAPERILVAGLGNCGGHVLERLAALAGPQPDLVAIHTDQNILSGLAVDQKVQIGLSVTHGLSAASDRDIGRRAAESDEAGLQALMENRELVFLVVGLGGGTGTGAAPVLARMAREAGARLICVATLPFDYEGPRRRAQAEDGLHQLIEATDVVVTIPNQKLFEQNKGQTSLVNAYETVDGVAAQCVYTLWNLLAQRGLKPVDFSDLWRMADSSGACVMASAEEAGADRVERLVEAISHHPLMDNGAVLAAARHVMTGIVGGADMTLGDIENIMAALRTQCRPDANLFDGVAVSGDWAGRIGVVLLCSDDTHGPPPVLAPPPAPREAEARPARAAGRERQPRQSELGLQPRSRGRFDKSEPTLHNQEDLDIPTFIRRGIELPS